MQDVPYRRPCPRVGREYVGQAEEGEEELVG